MKKNILFKIVLLFILLVYFKPTYCQSTPCGPDGLSSPDYTKNLNGGRAYIEYGNPNKKLNKPFIFVEGLNPTSNDPACAETNIRYGSFGWDIFTSGIDNRCGEEWEKIDLRYTPHLIRNLLTEGYDIIYVDFVEGAGNIFTNADVLIELLNYVNNRLDANGSNSQNILMGASMGGVICRVALTKMEKTGQDHNVRLWISMDAPHRGANIPVGGQKMIEYFNSIDIIRNNKPDIKNAYDLLNMDAPKQLLIKHFGNSSHQMRTDLISSPYYTFPVNVPLTVAIANGSKYKNQGYSPGAKIVSKEETIPCVLKIEYDIWALEDNINSDVFWVRVGSPAPYCVGWLLLDEKSFSYQSHPYDNTCGGYRESNLSFGEGEAIFEKHNFIPTFSALSINTVDPDWKLTSSELLLDYPYVRNENKNICPFDIIYVPNDNEQHVQTTYENSTFAVNTISPNDLCLQDIEIKGLYEARNSIAAGFSVIPSNPNNENVVVKANTSAQLNALNKITLKKGFKVERNAKFKASKSFSSSCSEYNIPLLGSMKSSSFKSTKKSQSDEFILDILNNTENNENSIQVYPNPFEDNLNIKLGSNEEILTISICDLLGKNLKYYDHIENNFYSLDLSDLTKGTYIIEIKTQTSNYIKRIIK